MCSSENRVAARASKLSRVQVQEVLQELQVFHPKITFLPTWVETHGDLDLSTSLRNLDKTDFFTREVDAHVLAGKCRFAVHSAKDLPDPLPEGLRLVALTKGLDPRDSLVMKEDLPKKARIGVSSHRREKNVRALLPECACVDIRGTIEKRLELLEAGKMDGLVVAEAALMRLKLTHLKRMFLPGTIAPLQGRLAVVARSDDQEMAELFSYIDARKILYLGTDPEHFEGECVHYPVIRIVPKDVPDVCACTHIIFTSKNAVRVFFEHFGILPNAIKDKCIIAIGLITEQHLLKHTHVDYVAEEETQEGIIALLEKIPLKDAHIFLPQSARARTALTEFLTARSIRYSTCAIYDTEFQKPEPVPNLIEFKEIVFTSPSTVEGFLRIFGTFPPVKLTAIGPITKAAIVQNFAHCI